MKRLFLYILILAAAIWLGLQIKNDPGYALFAYGQWTMEMPLWFAVLAAIIIFWLLHRLLLIIKGIKHLGERVNTWSANRKNDQAYQMTSRGLLDLAEGKWQKAEKKLIKAVGNNSTPLINYLAAAKAAQEQGHYEKRDDYLRLAHKAAPDGKVAVGLTQATLQLSHDQLEHSLATLRHLQTIEPHHSCVLKLLMQLYQQLCEWDQLLALLPDLKKAAVLDKHQLEELTTRCYIESIKKINAHQDPEVIQNFWHNVPKTCKKDSELVSLYVEKLVSSGSRDQASIVLRDTIKQQWSEPLVASYGKVISSTPDKQLDIAESWLKKHNHSATLYLTLGRLAKANQLWGKAKSYFHESINIEKHPDSYFQLGELLSYLNEKDAALEAYRTGLKLLS